MNVPILPVFIKPIKHELEETVHNSVEKNRISEFEIGCHLHVLQLATGLVHWIAEHKA